MNVLRDYVEKSLSKIKWATFDTNDFTCNVCDLQNLTEHSLYQACMQAISNSIHKMKSKYVCVCVYIYIYIYIILSVYLSIHHE